MRAKSFVGHWRKQDETAKILKISLGCCQQELGIGHGILQEDFRKYGWILQQCWIKELWRFLDEINGSITITDEWEQSRCENDRFLMRIMHDMTLSKDQIKKFNLCRLKKQVTFLSEIFHHDKNSFHPDLWTPDMPLQSNIVERFPKIEVPRQYWDLWRTVLQSIKLSQTIAIRQIGILKHKDRAKWLITTDCRYVYCKRNTQYTVHRFTHRQKHTLLYSKEPLFTTTIESYDHLRYITPTINDDFIAVLETKNTFQKATKIHTKNKVYR